MKGNDTYLTIGESSQGIYKEKGSRFISYAFPVKHRDQADEFIADLRKKHHDARHHCFAYVLKPDQSEFRVSDDGEPSNSAGQPILGQIRAHGLTNILVVVVRYFGGTLLGVGGLIRAYKTAAFNAIENATIITAIVRDVFKLSYTYDMTNAIMQAIEDPGIKILNQQFDEKVKMEIGIRKSLTDMLIEKLRRIQGLKIKYIDSG